jgi:hypothetical protein
MTSLAVLQSHGPLGTPPPAVDPNSANVELIFTLAYGAVVLARVIATVIHWRRTGSPIGLLLILGGMAATIQEPMVDTLGSMYIPPSHYTAFTVYGREMAAFVPSDTPFTSAFRCSPTSPRRGAGQASKCSSSSSP